MTALSPSATGRAAALLAALALLVAPAGATPLRDVPLDTAIDTNALAHLGDIAGAALAPTNAAIVVSNGVLRVDVAVSNGWRTAWSSAGEAAGEVAGEVAGLRASLAALSTRLAALEAAAPSADASRWAAWAADGSTNAASPEATMLNSPATLVASGFAWETSGAYAALASTGAVAALGGDTNGTFRISSSDGRYFGFDFAGARIVGCRCRSLACDHPGTPGGTVSMDYDYAGGDWPLLHYSPDLATAFEPVTNAVAWADNGDGTATAVVAAEAPRGFWYATAGEAAGSVFRTDMPAMLDGGVIGATNAAPVVYDSTIEISSGGRTYRIPAEAVR